MSLFCFSLFCFFLFLSLLLLILTPLATLQAQESDLDSPQVDLIAVDSTRFPTVTLYLDIRDSQPISLENLQPIDFRLTENGQPVSAESIQLSEDTTQPLNLVIALDRSTEVEDWQAVQQVIRRMFDALRPTDHVAILTFFDEVQVIQDFSQNKTLAKNVLTSVTAEGDFSALYQGVLRAVTLAQNSPPGRNAILLVGDAPDNISTTTADQLLATLPTEQPIPIYAFGFGPKAALTTIFDDLASATGGLSTIVDRPVEIEPTLFSIVRQAQQGYKLEFVSALPPNDGGYDLTLALGDVATLVNGRFMALAPDKVEVTVPSLGEGDLIGGIVDLTARTNIDLPIQSVEYRVDGQTLAQVENLDYTVIWDSNTVVSGPHILEVIVAHSGGEEVITVRNFNVTEPITVAVSLPPQAATGIVSGEKITVVAEINALLAVRFVELFVADVKVGSTSTEPYQLVFDSTGLVAGTHQLIVRAEDVLGRVVTDTLPIQIVPVDAQQDTTDLDRADAPAVNVFATNGNLIQVWFNDGLTVMGERIPSLQPLLEAVRPSPGNTQALSWGFWILLLIAPLIAYMVLRTALVPRPVHPFATARIALANQGNSVSRYQLYADDPDNVLRFEFGIDGIALNRPLFRRPQRRKSLPNRGPANSAGVSRSTARPITNMTLRQRRRKQSIREHDEQSATDSTLPDSVYQLHEELKDIYIPSPLESDGLQSVTTLVEPNDRPSGGTIGQSPGVDDEMIGLTEDGWVQLPAVAPGQTIQVEMLIQPLRQTAQPRLYAYRVISRCLERSSDPTVMDQSKVRIEGQSGTRPWLSLLLLLMAVAVLLILLYS